MLILLVYAGRWQTKDSLQTALSGQRGYRDTYVDKEKKRTRSSQTDDGALATLSPAESNPAVFRASPAPVTTNGLSRQPARSLQDWQVEDIILLATVDGKIHARDRTTGAPKWQLETDRPMVETIYHRHNKSVGEDGFEQEEPLWIVEPSQDGNIYVGVSTPGSRYALQRLHFTVKQLVDMSPYETKGHPSVAYTAVKRNALYTVDAGTGRILKSFSSAGSIVNDDRSCRRVNPLESLEEEEECEPIGTLTLGRTEYIIGIQDSDSGEKISTIRYFEWGPNNRDLDLGNSYNSTMDSKYIYTKYDGTVYGLQLSSGNDFGAVPVKNSKHRYKLSSPVARVYDIVRPHDDMSSDASLVVLPQPIGPSFNDFSELDDDRYENIFVNYTADGSWYALSESKYPTVTEGAPTAQCYSDDTFRLPSLFEQEPQQQRLKFAGVHQVSTLAGQRLGTPMIVSPEHPGLGAPPETSNETKELIPAPSSPWDSIPSIRTVLLVVFLGLVACGLAYRQQLGRASPSNKLPAELLERPTSSGLQSVDHGENGEKPMVREQEPATETIFPHDVPPADANAKKEDDDLVIVEINEVAPEIDAEEGNDAGEVNEPKKKKATRGKRGGKKQKEKEQQQAEAARVKKAVQVPQAAEVISVAASESPAVSGPLQINSLIIHTDKVIGQGSCGTSVFDGSFEGREVAVKRMLSQYYDLASQEVSFLQQSDDHPNVVRYFCQQKDDHFLYIAVELCQASLFEVWEAEKAKTDARQQQLNGLKLAIQQDVPKTLQQLAAGLYHLHNLRIIHRDIKPQNILVAFPKKNQNNGPRLVISDFGLGKNLPENVSTLVDPTGNAGTSGWKAPELISQPKDTQSTHSQNGSHTGGSESAKGGSTSGVKRAADIFSLGCLFFWVLTDGIHPFEDENGWQQLRELNIKRDNKKMGVLERWSDAYEPMQLITSMLAHQPENRPTALQVLNHPFFWPPEKRLAFLCDCSDHFEREPRGVVDDKYAGDSWHLSLLEYRTAEVIGTPADFLSKLDRHFVDTLGKQRKYSGNRLLDLLRALRNKKNHYEDMPEDVKKRVGPLAGGYLSYWSNRFPRLLMACYEVVHEAGVQSNDRFKGYFVMGTA